MNNNACYPLQRLLGDIEYEQNNYHVYASSVSSILSEPNSPSILKVLGAKVITATRVSVNTPLRGIGKINLIGISGEKITLILDKNELELSADLPLIAPPTSYRGFTHKYMKNMLNKLVNIISSEKPPLLVDTFIVKINQICRPRLGCATASPYRQLDHSINLGILYPKVVYPTILGWTSTRLTRSKTFSVPWICVGRKTSYANILCLDVLCNIRVTKYGVIELIEGKALYSIGTRCSKTKLYINYLLGNSYSDSESIEIKRPVLWSPTSAIPIGVQGDSNEIELCIWNPYPIAKLHELVFENHRVIDASVYSTETGEWEPLEPRYNRVNVGVRPLGLARLKLRLRELPPFLRKK